MSDPILDPAYWKGRLEHVQKVDWPKHYSIYQGCVPDVWQRIESHHRRLIATHVKPNDSILDVGCGYGRLPYMLPTTWRGQYLGIDFTPEFIEQARDNHPDLDFVLADMTRLSKSFQEKGVTINKKFDWAICISIRDMFRIHISDQAWEYVEHDLKKICKKILVLEYAEDDKGLII